MQIQPKKIEFDQWNEIKVENAVFLRNNYR